MLDREIESMRMVSAPNTAHFNNYLNDAVRDGYVPYGHFKVIADEKAGGLYDRFLYSQMMVKYKEA